jgi:hypothetical protein
MTGAIPLGSFVLGGALELVIVGCSGAAAVLVLRRRCDHLAGAPRATAAAILTIAGVLAAELVPLVLGVMTRGTVAIAAVLLLLGSLSLPARFGRGDPVPPPPAIRLGSISWLLAGVAMIATAVDWVAFVQAHAAVRVTSVDTLAFHLPGVSRYIQTGSLWHVAQFLPGQAQGNYPQYGDLLLLAAVLPWHSTALIRYVDPLLLAIAAVAVYALARELRASSPTSVLAACALVAIRPVVGPGLPDVITDPALTAGFASGALFLMRHWRTRRRAELVLAGIAFGIALGTKWYGLTDVPALVVIWLVAALVAWRPRRGALADGAVLIGVVALAGGIWMLRNLILTGNPVFDYSVRIFGLTIFPAPPDFLRSQLGFSLAHYFGDPSVLRRYAWPVFRSDFGLIGALLAGGALATAAWWTAGAARVRATRLGAARVRATRLGAARLRTTPVDARIAILAVACIALAAIYTITPYTAQGLDGFPVLISVNTRYAAPTLIVAAPLMAWVACRLGLLRIAVEVALLVAVVIDLDRYLPVSAGRLVLAAVLLAAAAAAWRLSRTGLPPALRAAPAAAVLIAAAVFAYHYQRELARSSYDPRDPAVSYALAHAPADTRIGLAGEWTAQGLVPVAPLFGPRLANDVAYVGPVIEHRLEQYRAPAPFDRALRRGRYRLLVVGTGFPPRPNPREERWARRIGYVPLVSDPRLVLLRAPAS